MKYDFIFEALRNYITAAAPNFVMRDDLVRLEGRVDELVEIATHLGDQLALKGHPGRPTGSRRRPHKRR